MKINDLVARYLETWNETDPAARRKAIDELWAADGVYTDPMATAAGRDQIDATIAAVQSQFAGLAFTLAGPVDAHHNTARFTPVGQARDLAVTTLRLVIEAAADGHTALAGAILQQVEPESPDNTVATVASCIGLALGLLDDWLSGDDPNTPKALGEHMHLPAGHWRGERAANDILVLARKGRAFRSLNTLITRQGGEQVLYGSALALAAATQTWAADTDTSLSQTIHTVIR